MRQEAPGFDRIRTLLTDHSEVAPIARLLGARLLSVEAGRVRVQFAVKPEFMHPGGVVQGGIVTAYGDVCMALAAHTLSSTTASSSRPHPSPSTSWRP